MATKTYKPGELLEELRAIRDRLSLKLLKMTPDERIIYINSLGKIDPTIKKPRANKRARPVVKRARIKPKQRA